MKECIESVFVVFVVLGVSGLGETFKNANFRNEFTVGLKSTLTMATRLISMCAREYVLLLNTEVVEIHIDVLIVWTW